jgi:hypothetical protein
MVTQGFCAKAAKKDYIHQAKVSRYFCLMYAQQKYIRLFLQSLFWMNVSDDKIACKNEIHKIKKHYEKALFQRQQKNTFMQAGQAFAFEARVLI